MVVQMKFFSREVSISHAEQPDRPPLGALCVRGDGRHSGNQGSNPIPSCGESAAWKVSKKMIAETWSNNRGPQRSGTGVSNPSLSSGQSVRRGK